MDDALREAGNLGENGIVIQNVPESQKLGQLTVACTIFNRTIGLLIDDFLCQRDELIISLQGSGIFVIPAIVLKSTNTVGASLLLWAFGSIAGMSALLVWLQLALSIPKFEVTNRDGRVKWEAVPRNGGEKNYVG